MDRFSHENPNPIRSKRYVGIRFRAALPQQKLQKENNIKHKRFFCLINVCFLCFCSSCFDFFFSFCFAFAPCHRCCCYLLCYVILHLALMLFGVVCHSLPCVAITYYDVWPSPCNATTISCGPSSFTLCCCCLPWCIIPRLALLLLAMVDCLHLALLLLFMVVCCYSLCGSSPFVLHCYCLLWCIAFTMYYCCLVWCIVPSLALLLLLVVVCHSSPCVVCCSLLCFATSSLHAFSRFSLHLPLCWYLLWFIILCLMLLLTC